MIGTVVSKRKIGTRTMYEVLCGNGQYKSLESEELKRCIASGMLMVQNATIGIDGKLRVRGV